MDCASHCHGFDEIKEEKREKRPEVRAMNCVRKVVTKAYSGYGRASER